MKSFDPLLFNGLGSERERRWNHILYIIVFDIGMILGALSIYLFNGIFIEKWYSNNLAFFISYIIIMLIFLSFLIIWLYLHILIFKHTRKNKNINKSNPLLVCEYQGSFKNYCVWSLGFMMTFTLYLILFILGIFIQPFAALVLTHFYLSKPFLLKRILLFEEYVILEYRIFGNMKLSREGLALITLPRRKHKLNISPIAFVRPVFFDSSFPYSLNDKYAIPYFCTRFNPFGMTNVKALWRELDSKMGYSAEEIITTDSIPAFGLKRVAITKDKQ